MAARSKVPKTTIVDIAAASGVSVATVSRILNNKPDVAEETRERVLRVMDEIGFAPQSAWRQIRSGRTRPDRDARPAGVQPARAPPDHGGRPRRGGGRLLDQHHHPAPDRCRAPGDLPRSPGGRDHPARDPHGRPPSVAPARARLPLRDDRASRRQHRPELRRRRHRARDRPRDRAPRRDRATNASASSPSTRSSSRRRTASRPGRSQAYERACRRGSGCRSSPVSAGQPPTSCR